METGRRSANNGGGKVVTFADAVTGMRRNGSLSSPLDVGNNKDAVDPGRRAVRPLPTHGMGSRRRTYTDGELDVFSAERYFKGAMDGHGDGRKVTFTDTSPALPPMETAAARSPAGAVVIAKPSSSTRASTVSSVSSANSQTVLFRGGRRGGSGDKKCCVQVGSLMRTCSGKRSVRVDGCATATKESHGTCEPSPPARRIDWYRELRMQKAALGLPGDGNTNNHGLVATTLPPSLSLGTAKVAAIGRDEKADELTFSSSSMRRSFALVAPVRATVPASNRVGDDLVGAAKCGDDDEDDDGSESSSDLFEIKSLMIEDCPYEPSEASIQWSVVTADAASERGDRVTARLASGGRGGRQYRDHRPVGLLAGCASHRAVDVSAAATRAVPSAAAAMQRRGDGFQKARRNGA